jgi:hypothetical protein
MAFRRSIHRLVTAFRQGHAEDELSRETAAGPTRITSSFSLLTIQAYRPWFDGRVPAPGSANARYSPEYAPPPIATMMNCFPSTE